MEGDKMVREDEQDRHRGQHRRRQHPHAPNAALRPMQDGWAGRSEDAHAC
jgi:hypothetical protein